MKQPCTQAYIWFMGGFHLSLTYLEILERFLGLTAFSYLHICSQCTVSLPPEKIRKTYNFLMSSGDKEKVHWERTG